MSDNRSLTKRLQLFMEGDAEIADSLLREVLPKLREMALRALRRERYMAPLSKTELISELWISHLSKGGWEVRNQGHFYALASKAMRRILVDLARKRLAQRRGGDLTTISYDATDEGTALLGASVEDAAQIVEIGILMEGLEVRDPDAARMVDMHYFTGFTLEEIAAETGLTVKQVRSRWKRGIDRLRRGMAVIRTGPCSRMKRGA